MQDVWERLRPEIRRLAEQVDCPLLGYPDPEFDTNRTPPFAVDFWPWAAEAAADLHRRFGADVALTVGAMSFPAGELVEVPRYWTEWPDVPTAADTEIAVSVTTPLTVASGHEVESRVTVHNRSDRPIRLRTSGILIGMVVDPATGGCVGGAIRQTLKLVTFPIAPGAQETIPFRVTTDSLIPSLGYAIPAGIWATQIVLLLDDHRQVKTPPLPLTVTSDTR